MAVANVVASAVALVVVNAGDSVAVPVAAREDGVSAPLTKNDPNHADSVIQRVVVDLGAQTKGDVAQGDGLTVDRQIRNSLWNAPSNLMRTRTEN